MQGNFLIFIHERVCFFSKTYIYIKIFSVALKLEDSLILRLRTYNLQNASNPPEKLAKLKNVSGEAF